MGAGLPRGLHDGGQRTREREGKGGRAAWRARWPAYKNDRGPGVKGDNSPHSEMALSRHQGVWGLEFRKEAFENAGCPELQK